MSFTPNHRRLFWAVAIVLVLVAAGVAVRFWLGGYAVRSVLRMAGASDIRYSSVRATPWHVEVDGLQFKFQTQAVAARRVVIDRPHWWIASLGNVTIEGAEWATYLDGSDLDPLHWSRYENGGPDEGVDLPFISLDLAGELVVRMAGMPDMPLAVKLEGRPKGGASWIGSLVVNGPGLRLAGTGSLLRAGQELEFQVQDAELDLATWARHVQRMVILPGGQWQLAGKLGGVAEGRVTANRFAATARVKLREGRFRVGSQDIVAGGVEADLDFSDLWKYRTQAAQLRIGDFRIGALGLRDVVVDFGLWGAKTVIVQGANASALGGTVSTDAFRYYLDQRTVSFTLNAKDLDPAQLLALVPEVPAIVPGRLGGALSLHVHNEGVRIKSGYLAWQPDSAPEMEFNALTLLRSGAMMDSATLKVLKEAGAAPLPVRLGELRIDIRPADAPLGSSARIHLAGAAPGGAVRFDYNVNGAIERYLRVLP